MSRTDDVFDGDELLVLREHSIIRLDAKLAEKGRLPIEEVTSFALLPDRSIIAVSTKDKQLAHHLVSDKAVTSWPTLSLRIMAGPTSTSYWGIDRARVERVDAKTGKTERDMWLGDNATPHDGCVQSDGTLVFPSLFHILHADKQITKFAWNDAPKHLCRGPEPMTLWANVGYEKLIVMKLEKGKATAVSTRVMGKGDTLAHLTSNGPLAAGIVAHEVREGRATFSLVVWDATKERFRIPLDDEQRIGRTAVLSATRVAALTFAGGKNVVFDLASGKPV